MDEAARALAQPRRRAILQLVRDRELTAGEIAARFSVTRPAISQHLRVLREAQLVSERRSGTKRLYRARQEGLSGIQKFLDTFWDYRLQMLKEAAEEAERSEG